MGLDRFIIVLVAATLIETMLATGLGVRLADVILATRDVRLITRAALAGYVAVPLAAILLLHAVDADPPFAAGILILAVGQAPLTAIPWRALPTARRRCRWA